MKRMSVISKLSAPLVLACLATPVLAQNDPRVVIGGPEFKPLPIAITTPTGGDLGQRITKVVSNNLRGTGLFRIIAPAAFIQKSAAAAVRPRFPDWKVIGAEALVTGQVKTKPNGEIRLEYRLWNVGGGSQMVGRALEGPASLWRRLAHKMSDGIYKRLTGEGGYFDTRIVYIAESGPVTRRIKRLAIMDQDGANHRFLTDGRFLVLTPRFSPNTQEITYLAYINNRPRVYIHNLDSGRREAVGSFPGMTFAPRFSPDGNKIVMSIERGGNSEIYTMDLRTRVVARLTNNPSIDTSPSFSPDGKRITFNSDRSGRQKIYVMNADGSGVTRISNGRGRYATPVWSPRGDRIAFTKMVGGAFKIGVMNPDGDDEKILTDGFLAEGPTWAPNGRVLMYFKQGRGGQAQIYTIDITGRNEQRAKTPASGSDPAWSPLLKN
jgi:TolB protein